MAMSDLFSEPERSVSKRPKLLNVVLKKKDINNNYIPSECHPNFSPPERRERFIEISGVVWAKVCRKNN